jgi:FkbM family methyltransferase
MKRKIFSQDDPVIIDIGANIGQFLYATKTLFPKSKVYSVEPDSSVFSILQKNAKNYSGVKIFNNALSKVGKTLKFYISKEFSEWSSLKRLDGKEYREIEVVAVRGDTLFNNVKKVDLLKIDVEGAEYEVLLGMPKLLKRSKYLLLEVSLDRTPTDIGSSKVFKLLLDSNFSIYRIGRMFSAGMGKEQGAVDILFKNMTFNE